LLLPLHFHTDLCFASGTLIDRHTCTRLAASAHANATNGFAVEVL
jgi:hypothetical protein